MTGPTETERHIDVLRHAARLLGGTSNEEAEAITLYTDAADALDRGDAVSDLPDVMAAARQTIRALL